MSINKVMISGNLTREPELRTTASGTSILSFGVAVNESRRGSDGSWHDYANFVDCSIFGRRADALSKILSKGMKVAIEGRLHYSSWDDKNGGGKRSKLDVNVDEIEFMQVRKESSAAPDVASNQYSGNDNPPLYNDDQTF